MKTPEERIKELEDKEIQRQKDVKDIVIFILVTFALMLLIWATATSVAGYFNTKEILEILKQ